MISEKHLCLPTSHPPPRSTAPLKSVRPDPPNSRFEKSRRYEYLDHGLAHGLVLHGEHAHGGAQRAGRAHGGAQRAGHPHDTDGPHHDGRAAGDALRADDALGDAEHGSNDGNAAVHGHAEPPAPTRQDDRDLMGYIWIYNWFIDIYWKGWDGQNKKCDWLQPLPGENI